jgi:hypothetical protein
MVAGATYTENNPTRLSEGNFPSLQICVTLQVLMSAK